MLEEVEKGKTTNKYVVCKRYLFQVQNRYFFIFLSDKFKNNFVLYPIQPGTTLSEVLAKF